MLKPKPVVIGFCGLKGHGKDTAAQALIENYEFTRVSLADGLKHSVAMALKIDPKVLYDVKTKNDVHKPSGRTYREWLQIAGTEWFRTMWPDIWINWMHTEIWERDLTRVVVPDVRFANELAAIKDERYDGGLFRVFNPRLPISTDTHESERYALTLAADEELYNNGSIPDLRRATIHAMNKHWVS